MKTSNTCPKCDKEFTSPQGRAAHERHCVVVPAVAVKLPSAADTIDKMFDDLTDAIRERISEIDGQLASMKALNEEKAMLMRRLSSLDSDSQLQARSA